MMDKHPLDLLKEEIQAAFFLVGFSIKEYKKPESKTYLSFEVHYRRTYLVKLTFDETRSMRVSNEYVDFGESCHSMSFGGQDTLLDAMQVTTLLLAPKLLKGYNGVVNLDPDKCEYNEGELKELMKVLNECLFADTE